jgi:hypothetical protein
MRRSVTRSLDIKAPAARVLASLSRIENLPDWMQTILQPASPGRETEKPSGAGPSFGKGGLPVEVVVDGARGTVDYFWSSSTGVIEMAAVRVIPMDGESQVVMTFFEPPEDCADCPTLEERCAAAEADLLMLKALLERGRGGGVGEIWH